MNPYKLKAKYPSLKIHKYAIIKIDKSKIQDNLSLPSVEPITVGSTPVSILQRLSTMPTIPG